MKKLFWILISLILLGSICQASPFVVCPPYSPSAVQPTYFRLTFNGGSPIQSLPESTPNGVRLHYDLVGLADGSYTMLGWGCNGPTFPDNCSIDSATLNFKKGKPVPVTPSFVTPFLNSQIYPLDQYLEPTDFTLAFDGGSPVQATAQTTVGGVWLHYDCSSLSDGNHTVVITPCSVWGCGTSITYSFSTGRPSRPSGLMILK